MGCFFEPGPSASSAVQTLSSQSSSKHLAFVFLLILAGCMGSGFRNVGRNQEVEIAPDEWLSVRMVHTVFEPDLKDPHKLSPSDLRNPPALPSSGQTERIIDMEETQLMFEWKGKKVIWRGREIPVSLRKHDGRLYMIGFNREELHYQITRLVFFEMSQNGTGFQVMQANDFPREIATQNMWMSSDSRYFGTYDGVGDSWDLVRNLKIEDGYFGTTLTAHIWYQIETGTRHSDMPGCIPQAFTREYSEEYNPIPLPTIVKE